MVVTEVEVEAGMGEEAEAEMEEVVLGRLIKSGFINEVYKMLNSCI
jgi:hypothetical protein